MNAFQQLHLMARSSDMKKVLSFFLLAALLISLLPALAQGPAGSLAVYFYDETAGRYGVITPTDRVNMTSVVLVMPPMISSATAHSMASAA